MSKPKLPHFPLFFGDLLAATPRPKWKGPHRSLYVLLLAHQWFYGPIPADAESIADMCDYPLDEFKRLWQVVGTKFVPTEGGLINLRCEEHREKASKISKKRRAAGKKGGEITKSRAQQNRQQNEQQTGQQVLQQSYEQVDKQTERQNWEQVATPLATRFAEPSIPSHPIPSYSNPGGAFGAEEDAPPPLDDPISERATPEGVIAVKLRRAGVQVTSQDPVVTEWVKDGITADRLLEAVGIARLSKPREVIPARYLDKVVRDERRMNGGVAPAQKTRGDAVIEEWLKEQAEERARRGES